MPSLTRDEAVERAELLRVHDYHLDLDLVAPDDTFGSTTVIRFACLRPGSSIFLESSWPSCMPSPSMARRWMSPA